MSGIAGIYSRTDRLVESADLERMIETLAHRGQDGATLWLDRAIGLGHRMLWTTPESLQETLPLETADFVVTADARIDNREELIAALGWDDRPPAAIADSELVLAAYQKWGEQCPAQLLGDFAFAIWDKRQQRLFCARDPMGVKPFYYYCTPHCFVFASEIKALLCLPIVPRRLNEQRVAEYLMGLAEDKQSTFYQEIYRLPSAHCLTVSASAVHRQSYWSLDPSREIRLGSNQEYAEAYRSVFDAAVGCRLRSAFPIGSMLSGGLDSSSIACMAQQQLEPTGQKLHTFSAIFPSLPAEDLPWIDERPYIDCVLAWGQFSPHAVEADRLSPLLDFDRVAWHMDEAVPAPNLYLHWALYQAAQQQGVRVLLDGIDGDSTVSHGQYRLTDLARGLKWRTLNREVKAYADRFQQSPRQVLWRYGVQPFVPDAIAHLWQFGQRGGRSYWSAQGINPSFAKRIQLRQYLQELNTSDMPAQTARQKHWHSLNSSLLTYMLEIADKAAAAFGVAPSYPFFDRRLMEFCLAIPSEQKFARGWTRLIARRGMAGVVPPEVQTRLSKGNLGINFKRRLLEWEREALDAFVWNQHQKIKSFVDTNELQNAYQRYQLNYRNERDAMLVYRAFKLELWMQNLE